jgi:formate-dependent nitrite reductase membrane component NrfD
MAETLPEVLERTGFRASLVPEYAEGHAPAAQRKTGQIAPPAPTYYDQPAIKKPEWKWYVPAYFFLGGMAGGAYITAAIVDLCGKEEDRALVRAGRYLQLAALAPCPALLIADLHRPERWHHMMRVFRPRSMMNQGSWGLTIFGLFSPTAALLQLVEDIAPPRQWVRLLTAPMRAFCWLGILPAAYVASYTGVLLSATNVPLWAAARYTLGPLFFTSGLSAGLAGTHLLAPMLGPVSETTEERHHRAETIVLATELALAAASALEVGKLGKPLKSGPLGRTYQLGALGIGIIAPLVLGQIGKKRRWVRFLSSALALAGSAITKAAITKAGMLSADDPHAYFEYTRE